MKTLVFILTTLLLGLSSHTEAQNICDCEVLLKRNGTHQVYQKKSVKSKVIYKLSNDTIKENYYIVIVYKTTNRWAYISAYSPDSTIDQKGCILKKKLGILTSEYPVLYKHHNKKSKKIQIENYKYDYLNILNCKDGWLKVKYYNGKKIYKGWLPPDNQCANPYTTCS